MNHNVGYQPPINPTEDEAGLTTVAGYSYNTPVDSVLRPTCWALFPRSSVNNAPDYGLQRHTIAAFSWHGHHKYTVLSESICAFSKDKAKNINNFIVKNTTTIWKKIKRILQEPISVPKNTTSWNNPWTAFQNFTFI